MGYYAVRDTERPRTWREGWMTTIMRVTTCGVVTHIDGLSTTPLLVCDKFCDINEARSFVMLVVMKKPQYLGRLAIHHVEWGTSGNKWLIGKRAD